MRNCAALLDFLERSKVALSDMSVAFFADFLYACESSEEEDREIVRTSPRQMLEALSWLSRVAQMKHLEGLLGNALISAFRVSSAPSERKVAFPLLGKENPRALLPHSALPIGGLLLALRIC